MSATPAELIRACRLRNGLTQSQLAIRLGTQQEAVSRIERGLHSPLYSAVAEALMVLGERPELVCHSLSERDDLAHIGVQSDSAADRVKRLADWSDFVCKLAAKGAEARKSSG